MAKQINLTIPVTTNAEVTEEQVAKLVRMLIDAGLADAQKTVEDEDLCSEQAALALDLNIGSPAILPVETTVPVKHWGAYDVDGTVDTHQFYVDDARQNSGQAYLRIAAMDEASDMIGVKAEVNTNPLDGLGHAPCLHVHFEDDSLAVSLFKIGNKILVRPETGVSVSPAYDRVLGVVEELFWVEER